MKKINKTLCYNDFSVSYEIVQMGKDIALQVTGGEPHVGCVVLAEPRESLKKDGSRSATSSVLNAWGHKDERMLRALAEKASALGNCRVAALGGVHFDKLSEEGLKQVLRIHEEALYQIESWLMELASAEENKQGEFDANCR